MTTVSIDFETRSEVDLRRAGVHAYAEHPSTEILCMAVAFDDEDVEVWTPDAGMFGAKRLVDHVRAGGALRAWNAQFERVVWREILGPRFGFAVPDLEQWYCTAADAAALALPRALEHCAKALALDVTKDADGHRLMMKMCKPRRARKGEDPSLVYWHDSPEDRARLALYCRRDVETERAVSRRIRPLSDRERVVYLADQRTNDRGILIDLPLVDALSDAVDVAVARGNAELDRLTDGDVTAVTNVGDLKEWLNAAGLPIENVQKATVRDLLAGDAEIPEDVRRVLELRQDVGKSSTAKLGTMRGSVSADARARGLLLFHGASTGRWTGKRVQPHNFARPFKGAEEFIPLVLDRRFDLIETRKPAMLVVSSLLRSCLVADEGMVFRSGDFEQIEARVVAWLAGQDDLVALFAGGGKVYETMAAFILSKKLGREVSPDEIENPSEIRTIGKNTVLGCGFGMGEDTFCEQAQRQSGIVVPLEDGALAVDGYRELYPKIPALWKELQRAAMDAVRRPGEVTRAGRNGRVRFVVRGQFLWCVLPSGRVLAYAQPRVERHTVHPKPKRAVVDGVETIVQPAPFTTDSLSYKAVQFGGWRRERTYGGKLTENIVQAIARDLMADAWLRVEDRWGSPEEAAVVLSVHDEIVAEVDPDDGDLEEFRRIMSETPAWAAGLPVSVGCWEGQRYRK